MVVGYIQETYLNEVPVGTAFMLYCQQKKMFCLFVILGMSSLAEIEIPYAFNGFYSALLTILQHNQRCLETGGDSNSFIKKVAVPIFPPAGEFIRPGEDTRFRDVVWQMSHALRFFTQRTGKALTGDELTQELRVALVSPQLTADEVVKTFKEYVFRKQIGFRGLLDRQEVQRLLNWVMDESDPKLQAASAIVVADYITSKRKRLPNDVSREELCRTIRITDGCLPKLLKFAACGTISLHFEISFAELEIIKKVGTGATAYVFQAKYCGSFVAYKEFHEGTDIVEFRKEVSMMR